MLIPVWALGIYCLCSTWYYRFFGSIPTIANIGDGNVFDPLVYQNIPKIWNHKDVWFIAIPAIMTVIYLLNRKRIISQAAKSGCRRWLKIAYAAGAVGLLISCQTGAVEFQQKHVLKLTIKRPKLSDALIATYLSDNNMFNNDDYQQLGVITYNMKNVWLRLKSLATKGNLSDADRKRIERYLAEAQKYDGSVRKRHEGNVILIIVESLDSEIVGWRHNETGFRLTPTLDSLLCAPNTFSALNVTSQAGSGVSSDGQLMYNTGLLPVKNSVTALNYADNEFPSLAKILNKRCSIENIYEQSWQWNHINTTKAYGYDQLYSFEDLNGTEEYLNYGSKDEAVFKMAFDNIIRLSEPFYCLITTISMHSPFNDKSVKRLALIDNLSGICNLQKDYMQMVHAFDKELGHFLNRLKENGLYDRSMIFIASDHNAGYKTIGKKDNIPVMFMALNTGASGRVTTPVGQIDVYPTILDLTGELKNAQWRGVGKSMLDSSLASSIDIYGTLTGNADSLTEKRLREAWEVSRLIIEDDYFKHSLRTDKE